MTTRTPRRAIVRGRFPSLAVVALMCSASALFLPRSASAQYKALQTDETVLSPEEQQHKNQQSFRRILALNSTQVGLIPVGFVPYPIWVGVAAESGQVAADTALKFTRAVLNAPADLAVAPNSANMCSYSFDLPQSQAEFKNFLGFWPKFEYGPQRLFRREHTDRLFLSSDTPISFGPLGVPEVMHANTDVDLSVSIGDASGFVEASDNPQTVSLDAGVHAVTWRADTLYSFVFDTALPAALIPVMIETEAKFGKYIKKFTEPLEKLRAQKLELASIKSDTKALEKLLTSLDRRIHLYKAIEHVAPELGQFTTEALIDKIVNGKPTVSRSRIQQLTVYDVLPPSIDTSDANPHFEATDIGGARTSRYADTLRSYITASDACGRPYTLSNDAPEVLPLGDTVVTWTVRDSGPTEPNVDHDGDGLPDNDAFNSRTVTQLVTIEDTQAPLLVPPPGVVVESAADVNLADQALGQPLVVDLADLHPTVASASSGTAISGEMA